VNGTSDITKLPIPTAFCQRGYAPRLQLPNFHHIATFPGPQMRGYIMSGLAVRHQFMREFRRLSASTRVAAKVTVASYFFQILAAIGLGYWLLQLEFSAYVGVGLVVLMLFIGTRLRGFNNIVHECCHFTFCERREDNVLLGSICAALILGSFRDYRDEHMTHHAHVGDYEHDRDLQRIRGLRLEDSLTASTIVRHVFTILSGRYLPYYLSVNLSSRDGRAFLAVKLGLMGLAFLFLVLDPVPAVLLVWLPYVWVFTAINYVTDCVDHGGLIGAEDELDSSRNLPLPGFLRVLFFPRNDCYHLVHHLFPQVPARHLGACHHRLLSHPEYRARMEGREPGRAKEAGTDKKRARNGIADGVPLPP
jgi:fatty acid desaturase